MGFFVIRAHPCSTPFIHSLDIISTIILYIIREALERELRVHWIHHSKNKYFNNSVLFIVLNYLVQSMRKILINI